MKKNFKVLRKIYWKLYSFYWKSLALYFPKYATSKYYKKKLGYKPNLDKPQTLNEKLQYLKINDYRHNSLVTQCADKLAVRDYVKGLGLENILNPLITSYKNASDIDFKILPKKFVLKCNHDSGGIIICRDKNNLNFEETRSKLNTWLKKKSGLEHVEFSYEDIKPKIICEQLIETEDGKPPKDYKIFCSYGEPKLLFVASDRIDGKTKFDYFTPDWEWIDVKNGHPNAGPDLPKPKDLDLLLDCARKLSKPFPIVRVDLYYEFGKIIFGELTFLHFGGVTPFDPKEYDLEFGKLFPLKFKENTK